MQSHFTNFTPEAMHAFRKELANGLQSRRELLKKIHHNTSAMLAEFQQKRREAEDQRRRRAASEADGRKLFKSELRSEIHTLKNRFELNRREMAEDFRQMARERRAASEMFHNRPQQETAPRFRHTAPSEPINESSQESKSEETGRSRAVHGEKTGKKRSSVG